MANKLDNLKKAKGFDVHPENINKNGRPPMLLTVMMRELREAGYERVSPSNIIEAYELLLGLDEEKLREIVNDKDKPMLVRIVSKQMLSTKGAEILEKMMDRAHGRAKTSADITTGGEKLNTTSKDVETIIDNYFAEKGLQEPIDSEEG